MASRIWWRTVLLLSAAASQILSSSAAFLAQTLHRPACVLGRGRDDGTLVRAPTASFGEHNSDQTGPGSNDNEGGGEENSLPGATPSVLQLSLEWNLASLLGIDAYNPKLIPLMDVYNAAMETIIKRQDVWYSDNESQGFEGPLSPELAPFRRFVRAYDHDMGHDGRFTVFGDGGGRNETEASLQAGLVFSMENPLEFIRTTTLSYQGEQNDCSAYDGSETVVFIPGLHTPHSRTDTIRSSGERVRYCSRVLNGLPMAQLHAGTFLDHGDVAILLTEDTLKALRSFDLLLDNHNDDNMFKEIGVLEDNEGTTTKVPCRLRAKDLDIIRTLLSSATEAPFSMAGRNNDYDSETLKESLMKLVDTAVCSFLQGGETSQRLTVIAYSATCSILSAALSAWKRQATTMFRSTDQMAPPLSEPEAESLLRKAVTVVTVGALCRNFCDGPAYIHVSMDDDVLVSMLGVKNTVDGGGEDAVYLSTLSPYTTMLESSKENYNDCYTNDAHNMEACAVQYLSLVLKINGIQSFRELYNEANAEEQFPDDINPNLFAVKYGKLGTLEMSPLLDADLLPSMIRATGGDKWLWDPQFQLGDDGVDGFDSPLPSVQMAEATLTEKFGYDPI